MNGMPTADALASPPLLQVRGLRVEARFQRSVRTIVGGLDFEVAAGEAVAIVGESGSGKSLAARAMLGLLPAGVSATGQVLLRGDDLLAASERERRARRGTEIALALQDPFTTLNPVRRCGDQIASSLRALPRRARRADAIRRLREVGLDADVADRYPLELSGGMRQRVGLAAALARDPRLLIADEPSTALDVTTQAEILALLRSLQRSRGMGLVLITHDLRVAFSTCDRMYVLYAGSVLETGHARELYRAPAHPYTLELLLSEPPVERTLERLESIPGSVPEFADVEGRCAFEPRCRWAASPCRSAAPALAPTEEGRWSRCVRLDDIGASLGGRLTESRRAHASVVRRNGTPADPVVAVASLRKTFAGAGGRDKVAVDDVSFAIGRGETLAVVGESGSGKTTVARCLAGLEQPTSGTIRWAGDDHGPRRRVGMVFQDPASTLNPALTIGATLREALRAARQAAVPSADVERLLETVGLPTAYRKRLPIALSGGERQRVAVARALAGDPRLVICDEPVSALDASVQAQIVNLLVDLQRELGISYLFITHDLAVARQVAGRILVMQRGRVVESGSTEAVLARPDHPYTRTLIASVPHQP